jgi:hypothetical protein
LETILEQNRFGSQVVCEYVKDHGQQTVIALGLDDIGPARLQEVCECLEGSHAVFRLDEELVYGRVVSPRPSHCN